MLEEVYIKDIMTRRVTTLKPEDRVLDHLKIFDEHNINHVPVITTEFEVAGIVSRKDFENYVNITRILHAGEEEPVKVKDVMTAPAFTFSENIHIGAAAQAMIDNQIHAIVITDSRNQLAGIITSTDLLEQMAGSKRYKNF